MNKFKMPMIISIRFLYSIIKLCKYLYKLQGKAKLFWDSKIKKIQTNIYIIFNNYLHGFHEPLHLSFFFWLGNKWLSRNSILDSKEIDARLLDHAILNTEPLFVSWSNMHKHLSRKNTVITKVQVTEVCWSRETFKT